MTSSIDAIFASAEQEFLAAGRAAGAAAAPANSSAADSGMPVFAPAETTAAGEPESSQASLPPPPTPAAQPANSEEPYAASDDELDDAPPGAGSGDARRGRKRGEPSSRSSFKARVIKEVKTKLHAFYSAGRITSKEDFKQLARLARLTGRVGSGALGLPRPRQPARGRAGLSARLFLRPQAKETSHKILSKDPKRTTWDDKMPVRVRTRLSPPLPRTRPKAPAPPCARARRRRPRLLVVHPLPLGARAQVQKYVDGLFARDFIYDPSRKKGR